MVARVDHDMIRPEGRSRRGPHMSATPDSTLANPERLIADLQRQLAECKAERDEAREQQTATAEVLQVINSSPGDLTPAFDAMLDKAMGLCDAAFGMLQRYDGERFEATVVRGLPPAYAEFLRNDPPRSGPGTAPARILAGEQIVHIHDLKEEQAYRNGDPRRRAMVDLGGARTSMAVALRNEGTLLGTFTVFRHEVRPFSDKQIALLQNFAAQAVIAMENARLLGELRERTRDLEESLEYQTATSDVLKVISRSGAELAPMLDTLVETAARICRAESGFIFRLLGGLCHMVASFGIPEEYKDFQERNPIAPGRGTLAGRIALDRCPVHIEDAATDPEYTRVQAVHLGRQRTMLGVPLVREDALIGVLTLARSRVEPFAEKEIALVTTFADQAVIAMENARLFDELHGRTRDLEESLEYQTATSDVLQVMSRSTFELQPVLETLVETAARLCKADMAFIHRREGELYYPAVNWGFPPEFEAFVRARGKFRPHRGTLSGRALLERRIVRIDDYDADPELIGREATALGKARTGLGVPLLREGEPIGVIALTRQRGEPFTERQIELVRTFADQAVIAIENSRLITETREALERQQAIAEVLQVINSSPGNLSPVYEVILEKARNLCGVPIGYLALYDGQQFRAAALHGIPQEFLEEARRPFSPGPAHERLVRGEPLVHIPDFLAVSSGSGSPASRALVALGVRTTLLVPLRRDTTLLGYIAANRLEVRPFSEKEIALLESFAAQAVIAMDNARLLDEIRQRQAELRVTFDNMGDGVAMFDANLQLAAWNRNFQQILDIPDAMLVARPSYVDYLRTLARRGEFGSVDIEAEVARRVAAIDQELHFEHTRPDGHIIEVRRNAVPGGGFVLIYGDVTERKRADAEIRAARDAAERALGELRATQQQLLVQQKMAALGQLTAGIAHEIKNPLNFVNNFAGISIELLDELKADAEPALATLEATKRAEIAETVEMLTGNLEKIAEHGRRADGIVKSMLEHSRGSSADRRAVDLNGLVEEALNLAYHGGRAQDQSFNVTLERDYAAAVAPIELVPQDITRVCLNLIGNGFYATTKRQKEGKGDAEFKPTLKVSTRDLGSAVEIRIRDNGIGIAPEFRDRLFQPFFTTKPTGEGTGLGLSISYDIVTQEHGGTITVDSQVGEFTEFTVRLPRVYGAAVAEAAS
jgi:two-component system, NtrC family, sensor kinase